MKKSSLRLSAQSGVLLALTLTTLVATEARAQGESTSPPPASTSSGAVGSSGAGSGAGLGVGAAAFVSGLSGIDVVYDVAKFHLEGILAFSSQDAGPNQTVTAFQFGARGWYHLHVGTNSDFSLGGGIGVLTSSGGGGPSTTTTLLEPGMQTRVFLTPNFTLNLTAGLTIAFGDSMGDNRQTGFRLAPQLLGGIGFTYFFR